MRRLVFIDDDRTELQDFAEIVGKDYDCQTVHWPGEAEKLFNMNPRPDIFVSDLYLPPIDGDTNPTAAQRDAAAGKAEEVAHLFLGLYADASLNDKQRLQKTMAAISDAYRMIELQWTALGQSPDHGVALLTKLRSQYPEVPFVFFSRKITPEDVIRVLRAGPVDAIRKGALKNQEVLVRLAAAQELWRREDFQRIRGSGLNVNATLSPA